MEMEMEMEVEVEVEVEMEVEMEVEEEEEWGGYSQREACPSVRAGAPACPASGCRATA